ncbi:MAG: RDD family protein [Endozoicomonadaceae bacterium]|nr:RDD family protein [Endozoicomonadaceae bacterium]
MNAQEYAGFWIRTGAAIIDSILMLIITLPILAAIYGTDYWMNDAFVPSFFYHFVNYILPAIVVIIFWVYKSSTPGKMATNLIIVDAKTGGTPTTSQFIGRYFGYYVSVIPLCLGIIWIGIDNRKQGWHDKLAGTVVIRNNNVNPIRFEDQE